MKWYTIFRLNEGDFLRLTGVKRSVFDIMLKVLKDDKAKNKRGARSKLIIEDSLLLTLEYYREYRTMFHIGKHYGVCEATVFNTIRRVEEVLIRHKSFSLPGKKALLTVENSESVILIDASETPIQRPKKTKKMVFREEKTTHNQVANHC